jgi:hypothetical protein
MATLVHNCPHCGATHAAFTIVFCMPQPQREQFWNVFALCPACGEAIGASIYTPIRKQLNPQNATGNVASMSEYSLQAVYPAPVAMPTPEHVPEAAGRAFAQGARCLSRADFTPAAAMFRRCLEIALKAHSPEIEAWKLEKLLTLRPGRIESDSTATTRCMKTRNSRKRPRRN